MSHAVPLLPALSDRIVLLSINRVSCLHAIIRDFAGRPFGSVPVSESMQGQMTRTTLHSVIMSLGPTTTLLPWSMRSGTQIVINLILKRMR